MAAKFIKSMPNHLGERSCASRPATIALGDDKKQFLKSTASVFALALLFGACAATDLHAQQQFWDPDTATTSLGGSGEWDDTTENWRQTPTGTHVVYDGNGNPPLESRFSDAGIGRQIEIKGAKNVGDLIILGEGYTFGGDDLVVSSSGIILDVQDHNDGVVFNAAFAGTGDISKTGFGGVELNATNTNTGLLTVEQGQITNSGTIAGNVVVDAGAGLSSTGVLELNLDNFGNSIVEGEIHGNLNNNGAGVLTVSGVLDVGGTVTNNSNAEDAIVIGSGNTVSALEIVSSAGGISNSGSITAPFTMSGGRFDNKNGGQLNGNVTIDGGTFSNDSDATIVGNIDNASGSTGVFVSAGTITGNLDTVNTPTLSGTINGSVTSGGNNALTISDNLTISGYLTNNSTDENAIVVNNGAALAVDTLKQNAGTIVANGDLTGKVNVAAAADFSIGSTGEVTGNIDNSGNLSNDGVISGTVDVSGGTFDQSENASTSGVLTISNSAIVNNAGTLGEVKNQAGATFINEPTGEAAGVTNAGTVSNSGSMASLDNSAGTVTNDGLISGAVNVSGGLFDQNTNGSVGNTLTVSGNGEAINSGTLAAVDNQSGGIFINENGGTATSLTNSGSATNDGLLSSSVNNLAGDFTNSGDIDGNLNVTGGDVNNAASGDVAGNTFISNGSDFTNAGSIGDINIATGSAFSNLAGATTGNLTNAGTSNNAGTIASLNNASGSFNNSGSVEGDAVVDSGTVQNTGLIGGALDVVGGAFNQLFGGQVDGDTTIANGASLSNAGLVRNVTVQSGGNFSNQGTGVAGDLDNSGVANNTGTIAGLTNNANGTFINQGTINGFAENEGTLTSNGAIQGGLRNTGTANIDGILNGDVVNEASGNFNLVGVTTANGVFTNRGRLDTGGWNITGLQVFNNAGVINVNGISNIGTIEFNSLVGNNVNLADGVADDVLNITGNLTQAGAISFDIDSVTQTADLINVGGLATVGGPVNINLLQGGVTSETTFLTAQGGIVNNGVFVNQVTGLTNPLAETSLVFPNANELAFSIVINAASGNFNYNQTQLQKHINSGGSNNVLNNILQLASAEETENALDQLGAEIYLNQQLATHRSAVVFASRLGACENSGASVIADGYGNCTWIAPYGGELESDRTSENIGYSSNFAGVAIGLEREISEDSVVGVALGFESRGIDNQVAHSSDAEQFNIGASFAKTVHKTRFVAAVAGGVSQAETTRNIKVHNLSAKNSSEHDTTWLGGKLRVERHVDYDDNAYAKPSFEFATTYLNRDAITEQGEASSILSMESESDWITVVTPAIEVGKRFQLNDTMGVNTFAKLGVELNAAGQIRHHQRFANSAGTIPRFDAVQDIETATASVEAGANFIQADKTEIKLGYKGRFSGVETQHSGYLVGNFKF